MLLFETYAEHYFALEDRRATLLRDVRGLLRIFRGRGCNRLLDLGCGTGEHAAVLNRAGMTVLGLDHSDEMIQVARTRFPGVAFAATNMCEAQAVREFVNRSLGPEQQDLSGNGQAAPATIDGAFCLFGTLNYLHEDEAVSRAFRATAGVLREGGLLILEVWNPDAYRNLPPEFEVPQTERVIQSAGREIRRRRKVRFDSDSPAFAVIQHQYEVVEIGDQQAGDPALHSSGTGTSAPRESFAEEHRLRLFQPEELQRLAAGSGLRLIETHADLGGRKSRPSSAGRLLIFEK